MRWTEADIAQAVARMAGQGTTLPRQTPEGALLAHVRRLAAVSGWLCYHTHNSEKSERGFPDTVLTNGVDILMYELKNNQRKPTPAQETWLHMLAHTGKVECGIWRPRDWETIEARLTRRSAR